MMKDQPTVIFLHIPKTAGTTLHTIMGLNYPPEVMFATDPASPHPLNDYAELDESEKKKIKVIVGHFPFGMHTLIPGDSTYITVLREPIVRMISEFYHIRRDPMHGLCSFVQSGEMDLKGYLEHLEIVHTDNRQTRMFAGDWRNNGKNACSEEMLETAKMNLKNHFAVVGLTERFDESLLLIGKKLDWKHLIYTKRNVTKNRPEREKLPADQLQVLREHNKFDLMLYQFAEELLEAQVQRQDPSFFLELENLHANNAPTNMTSFRYAYLQIRQRSARQLFSAGWQRIRGVSK